MIKLNYDRSEVKDVTNNDIIWCNDKIMYKSNCLYFKKWVEKNIVRVKDLYCQNNEFCNLKTVQQKIKNHAGLYFEYNALKNALKYYISQSHTSSEGKVIVSSIQLYNLTVGDKIITKSQTFWERNFQHCNFEWPEIYKLSFLVLKEPRINVLQWKLLHNIYPTALFLKKIGKFVQIVANTVI